MLIISIVELWWLYESETKNSSGYWTLCNNEVINLTYKQIHLRNISSVHIFYVIYIWSFNLWYSESESGGIIIKLFNSHHLQFKFRNIYFVLRPSVRFCRESFVKVLILFRALELHNCHYCQLIILYSTREIWMQRKGGMKSK